jgi:Tol biopolymer transport system component
MTTRDVFDARLAEVIGDLAAERTPEYLRDIQANAHRTSQRPRWRYPSAWLPFDPGFARFPTSGMAGVPRIVALVALLLLLFAVSVLLAGQRRAPGPFAQARNGAVAWDDGRQVHIATTGGRTIDLGGDGVEATRPTYSPDGRHLAFREERPNGQALVMTDPDGSSPRDLLVLGPDQMLFNEPPTWSPDSRSIAVSVLGTAGGREHAEVWIVDVETRRHVVLLPRPVIGAEQAVWSPDGTKIAFLGEHPLPGGEESYLYSVKPDGTNLVRLSSRPNSIDAGWLQQPRWSPDGTRIAVHYGKPLAHDILLLAADHEEESFLLNSPVDETQPAWSPTADRIAYWLFDDETKKWELAIIKLDTREVTRLGFMSATADSLTWSPDGASVVASTCELQICRIMQVSVDDHFAPVELAKAPAVSYDLSHDQAHWSWQALLP